MGEVEQAAGEAPLLEGWPLAGAAAGVFLMPLLMAMAGAVIVGDSAVGQLAGGAAGLALGMLLARSITRLVGSPRPRKEK